MIPAEPPPLPRAALVVMTLVLACVFGTYKVLQHEVFLTQAWDTGIYANVAWNLAHGNGFHSAVLQRNHLGEHVSPVIALFAPVVRVWPSAVPLLLAQALACALTFPLLALIVEHLFEGRSVRSVRWATAVLLSAFLVYRPFFHALHFEFHPSTLGMPVLAGAILALHRGSRRWLWISVVVLLLTKEVAVASVSGLALYAWLVLGRRRVAGQLFGAALVWGVIALVVVIPAFRGETWRHYGRIGPLELLPEKLRYLALLPGLLLCLPLLAPRALVAAGPNTLLNCAVSYWPQVSLIHHYDDQNVVFWAVAAAHGAHLVAARAPPRLLQAGLAAALVSAALLPWSNAFAAFRRLLPTAESRALNERLAPYVDAPELSIVSSANLAPQLGMRARYTCLTGDSLTLPFADGDLILAPVGFRRPHDGVQTVMSVIRADPRAEVVEADDLLEVYRWHER